MTTPSTNPLPIIIPATQYSASRPSINSSTPDMDACHALRCLLDSWEQMMGPTSADPDGQASHQFAAHHQIIHRALAQWFAGQP